MMTMRFQWVTEMHTERLESHWTITFKVDNPSAQCLVAVGWECEIKSMTLLGIDINVTHVLPSVICIGTHVPVLEQLGVCMFFVSVCLRG